ncbi:MAG: HAMP domain-containing sensor histidine kinase, partial [Bacteroidales bacterium]|nr:HAMP domain-containing sensor histidine kinase [Bacteroidales bacterium]
FSFIAFISLFVINILHIFSFTHLSFNAVIKIQYITIYLMISTLLLYIYYLYPLKSEKIRVFIICAINLLLVALSAVLPVYLLSWVIHYSKFIITLTIVYGVFYAINILKRKEEMSWIMIVGLSLITITSSVDLYMSTHYLQLANSVSRIGILLFILSQIFLLLKKFVDTQNQLEKLTKDLKHINNNLEKIVNSRTQKLKSQKLNLEDQRRQLKKIVKTKNKLFSIIGHDLRSPIGIANMYADTMLEDKTLKSKQHEMLKFISDSSSAALHLLNNLLMWGKSETGTVIYRPTYFDIQELFVESINQFKGAMEAKDLKFTINSENQIIFADRFMIFMVVNNVLSNAVKFSEPGKIIKATIHNIIIRKRKNVVIQIEDEGVGMSPELIETVLKTNEYISQRGTKNEKGSGLGLKICRDFIKQNNGKFNILSEKGKGTTIEIIIPVKIWD